jgi:hypothetical protein
LLSKLEMLARLPPLLSWPEPSWHLRRRQDQHWRYATWTTQGGLARCWSRLKTWQGPWRQMIWFWWVTEHASKSWIVLDLLVWGGDVVGLRLFPSSPLMFVS